MDNCSGVQNDFFPDAVKKGRNLFLSALDARKKDGSMEGIGSVFLQSVFILKKLELILNCENLTMNNIVRLRIWLLDINERDEVIRAASAFFNEYRPAAAFAESSNFVHFDSLVQIEADVIIE